MIVPLEKVSYTIVRRHITAIETNDSRSSFLSRTLIPGHIISFYTWPLRLPIRAFRVFHVGHVIPSWQHLFSVKIGQFMRLFIGPYTNQALMPIKYINSDTSESRFGSKLFVSVLKWIKNKIRQLTVYIHISITKSGHDGSLAHEECISKWRVISILALLRKMQMKVEIWKEMY
jgi:hypothetical protein